MEINTPVAVVPIVVNAGAALLPAFMAVAASVGAMLFKPRELLRVCRARPGIAAAALICVGAAGFVGWTWFSSPPVERAGSRRGGAQPPTTAAAAAPGMVSVDWTRVALARIEAMNRPQGSFATSVAANPAEPDQGPTAAADSDPRGSHTTASAASTKDANGDADAAMPAEPFIFRGGVTRLGSLGGEIEGPLQLAWNYHPRWLNEGVEQEDLDAMVLSSPAVWGERVFGASCTLDPPDSFGSVFCLDAASGKQIWSVDQADDEPFKGFFSSPAISADGRNLVIGQGLHPDSNCRLLCLDTDSGQVRWTLQVPLHIESSATIDGDMVYVGAGAIENPSTHKPIGHPGFVLAVRLSDGKEMWRFDVNDPESSPAMRAGNLFIGSGFNGNAVVAIDTTASANGSPQLLWRTPSQYPITGAVTLAGDSVFAGGGNGDFVFRDPNPAGVVLALQATDGEARWTASMPDAVLGAVAAAKRLICPVANGQVVALDTATGETVWSAAVSGTAPVLAAAAVTEREVFAVSQNGYLGRLQLETGEIIERVYLNAADKPGEQGLCISSPLIAEGRLFVGSETGGLRCYTGGSHR